jgi:23S rRNA (guanine745-N1)-methyltransferase
VNCPWICPVCGAPLEPVEAALRCAAGHSFDISREGYVNLLVRRASRQPGDSVEMIRARARFLATGAYDRMTAALAHVAARVALGLHLRNPGGPITILDVGCGEGHHTRVIAGNVAGGAPGIDPVPLRLAALDVAKAGVAAAARADTNGWYAVASAAAVPMATSAVDVALSVFGPVFPDELARLVRPGGAVIAAHPGTDHLGTLRALVYGEGRGHDNKAPLRDSQELFARAGSVRVTFPITITEPAALVDLFTMTPYRWHGPPDIVERLQWEAGRPGGFATDVDVVITSYTRTAVLSP